MNKLFDLSLFGFSVCISRLKYYSYLSFLSVLVANSGWLVGFAVPYSIYALS